MIHNSTTLVRMCAIAALGVTAVALTSCASARAPRGARRSFSPASTTRPATSSPVTTALTSTRVATPTKRPTRRATTPHPVHTRAPVTTHAPRPRPTTSSPRPRTSSNPPPRPSCDPAYPGTCLHDGIGDYDCAGGSGNGPHYVDGPIRVRGSDPFDLDRDGDGVGCD